MARVRCGMRTYAENRRKRLQEQQDTRSSNNQGSSNSDSIEEAPQVALSARLDEITGDVEALKAKNSELWDQLSSLEEKIEALEEEQDHQHKTQEIGLWLVFFVESQMKS